MDVAYGYHLRSAPYVAPLTCLPRVVAFQPAQVLHFGRRCAVIRNPFKRAVYRVEHRRLLEYERKVAARFERCLLISETDRRAIDPEGALGNVFYNPHGTDVAKFAPPSDMVRDSSSLVFAGAMSIDTNTDAIQFFVQRVLPLIWRHRPTVKLQIVGRHPPREQLLRGPPRLGRALRLRDGESALQRRQGRQVLQ